MAKYTQCPNCSTAERRTVIKCNECGQFYCTKCSHQRTFAGAHRCPRCDSARNSSIGKIR